MTVFILKIKEWDEVCDCGNKVTCDYVDRCCQAKSAYSRGCNLRSNSRYNYQCSGQQGPCCDGARCQFRNKNILCDPESSCTQPSYCNGKCTLYIVQCTVYIV